MALDVTVSSIGDAKSLEGGVLLLTPLHGAGWPGLRRSPGSAHAGRILGGRIGQQQADEPSDGGTNSQGGTVERDTAVDLNRLSTVSLMLREPRLHLGA